MWCAYNVTSSHFPTSYIGLCSLDHYNIFKIVLDRGVGRGHETTLPSFDTYFFVMQNYCSSDCSLLLLTIGPNMLQKSFARLTTPCHSNCHRKMLYSQPLHCLAFHYTTHKGLRSNEICTSPYTDKYILSDIANSSLADYLSTHMHMLLY